MGLKLCALASGSKGNAIVVTSAKTTILLDLGISYRDFCGRMDAVGLSCLRPDGLLISHAHIDHIRGAEQFAKHSGAPVFAHFGQWAELDGKIALPHGQRIGFEGSFSVGDIEVHPFATPHDSTCSRGFCLKSGGDTVTVATDLGRMTREVFSYLSASDLVLLESNYDEYMLETGPYPYPLKRRIAGEYGHLSNTESGKTAAELAKRGLKKLLLGHLSENNNTPEKAFAACRNALSAAGIAEADISVTVAMQRTPTPIFSAK